MVEGMGDDQVHCTFHEPVFGITAGQAAVFYDGDTVLGGGIIAEVEGLSEYQTSGFFEKSDV
jgi:tRNA-specific 2-thiouridylase